MTAQEKTTELNTIAAEIKAFKDLDIAKAAHNPVPGEGNPDTDILFIGEAPGAQEDATGRPFVGQSGQLLARILQETTGLNRSDVFISNIVKYRPPDNRDPSDEEIIACKDWLDRQIDVINPKIIVTLGRFSMGKFIPGVTISKVHGMARKILFSGKEYLLFPMFHPAAALRAGDMMASFKADFVKLAELLKPAPVTPSVQTPSKPEVKQESLF